MKQKWKPGNMLYPLPVVMVSCADKAGNDNIITIAWTGTICSDPAMLSISVRPERHSYKMIEETGEFVINLTTEELAFATDYCGVKSGRDMDKWAAAKLTREKADIVSAPMIKESPVNIECKVEKVIPLGTHHMFIAKVLAVDVDENLINNNGKLELKRANLVAYSHGDYLELGKKVGTFGFSVKRKSKGIRN